MFKFVTHFGSYTLVVKDENSKVVYDHKGSPIRTEGATFCEFKSPKGASVGLFETSDEALAERLRSHKRYGSTFSELKAGDDLPSDLQQVVIKSVKLPKGALQACKKDELIEIAKGYSISMDIENETKNSLVEKILKAQAVSVDGAMPTEEKGSVQTDGALKTIKQIARAE